MLRRESASLYADGVAFNAVADRRLSADHIESLSIDIINAERSLIFSGCAIYCKRSSLDRVIFSDITYIRTIC